ncbi:alpha-galactosidase [Paracoccus sp. Z330]|uniref:alpha-galactosidase n=1 Tax=Paracoccus onchidii TaxID=3017813 RepID=A0ABT4ZG42_9RHOB|nr:alpha-galactosidase [Paracoccus onchidii]MDB6178327.1 alpha-galactosidase [Paracoccus onchidii]
MSHAWHLRQDRQSLVLASSGTGLPRVIYWGPPLPEDESTDAMLAADGLDYTGGMMDGIPDLSICPEARRSFPGQPGLGIRDENGKPLAPVFEFAGCDEHDDGIVLTYVDAGLGLTYTATFGLHRSGIIRTSAGLSSQRPLRVEWLAAPVMPAPQLSDELIDFAGRWVGEFQLCRSGWGAGIRMRESRTGRSGHEHFPGLILPVRGATNTQGQAYAFHYGWSGGHRMIAEELPDGRRQIQFGHAAGTELEAGTQFQTAPLLLTFSDQGLNGCAVAFQRHLRNEVVRFPDPDRARPLHYNCWEAVYFKHDLDELKKIATMAADLGAERFVLDDGWFGNRDDDLRALGDWVVDTRKYPDGLDPLIAHIHSLGMSFGIWFEPEMVNPDSDLYRAHPDWALGDPDQLLGRQQMVLDMSRTDVRDYLYDRIATVLADHAVDYVKWDHNRLLPMPDAAQTRGVYALIDRLRADFPGVEIESCASGGGRIDAGILSRTHRVWLSDSNDAQERLRIQHDAALFLPACITGSHVGPRECHTSGRVLDIRFRAWVAAQRHMGFEMDPRELTLDEADVLREVTSWWKRNRDWMMGADILRLDGADPSVIAEQQVAADGSQFVLFAGVAQTSPQISQRPLRLTGLQPDARYRVDLCNRGEAGPASRGRPALKEAPLELSGRYLMNHGIVLPNSFPQRIWVVEGKRL